MKLPLPRSRRARLVAGVVVLAAAGGIGAGTLLLGSGEVAASTSAAAAADSPRWQLTVDEAALPEAPVPADAPVVSPEGPDRLLSLE